MIQQKVRPISLLIPLLEDSYRAENTEHLRRNLRFSDAGAAADAGEVCERAIYYDFEDTDLNQEGKQPRKSALTPSGMAFFADGRLAEEDIRSRLRPYLRAAELETFDPATGAKGKIDNLIHRQRAAVKEALLAAGIEDDGDDPILEVKSINQYGFDHVVETGKVSQKYYDQVQMYLWEKKRRYAFILFKNRNSFGPEKGQLPYVEFLIEADPVRQQQILVGWKVVLEARAQKVEPMRPFERASTNCQFCRHKFHCWGPEPAKQEAAPDPAVEMPSQELVESALQNASSIQSQLKELEEKEKEARGVLRRYFQATGQQELIGPGAKATYALSSRSSVDIALLKTKISPELLIEVAEVNMALLRDAVANRKLDAKVIEDSTSMRVIPQLRVTPLREPPSVRVSTPPAPEKKEESNGSTGRRSKQRAPSAKTRKKQPKEGATAVPGL